MNDHFKQLGDQEVDVLRYIDDNQPVTLRKVIDGYGNPRNLARTTILTVVDRLRKKGFLNREKINDGVNESPFRREGVFVYTVTRKSSNVMTDLVKSFVSKTLGGSTTPFVEYLIESKGLTQDEAKQLREILDDKDDEK